MFNTLIHCIYKISKLLSLRKVLHEKTRVKLQQDDAWLESEIYNVFKMN